MSGLSGDTVIEYSARGWGKTRKFLDRCREARDAGEDVLIWVQRTNSYMTIEEYELYLKG